MFQPGSIRKIEVRNFVTYSHVEMYPGPHLNMIIGPNGTGKSTMVAAIILGLGGTPKVVGRGTRISEYVKHNCDSASVTIFLQTKNDNQYIKITREFDTHDRNSWKLNNRKVKFDDVSECIKEFNIQINNLCQFLPQDRVQDFAKLNKQDLLKETQIALCQFDLIEKQKMLINRRANEKEMMDSLTKITKDLEQARSLNARLENRVVSFNKKKEYLEKIENVERKTAWMMYEDFRMQLGDIKKDRSKAQEVYDRYQKLLKPLQQKVNETKKLITQKQHSNTTITQLMSNIKTVINSNIGKWEKLKESIKKLEDDVQIKFAEIEQWDKEIDNASVKLEEMKKLQKEIQNKHAMNQEENNTLSSELSKLMGLQKKLRDQAEEVTQINQETNNRVRALQNETQRLENVKNKRLQHLERVNPDAHKAVNWLKNNKHLFEDEIFEPIMLEVNIVENRFAKYVENVIPNRDRFAFTCVNKNDMNKLIRCLRETQKLSVNVVHSDSRVENAYQPSIPIERLRKFGFFNYVNNLFTTPTPIMNYLCKTYNLHNIPVGDTTTNETYEQIPNQIRNFFSDKYRYSISFSKYSGQKSCRQIEIHADGGLSLSLDIIKLNQLKGEIAELEKNLETYNTQCQTFERQISKCDEKIKIIRDKMKEIHQEGLHAQTIDRRIQTTQAKIAEMRQLKKSPEAIEAEAKSKIRKLVINLSPIQQVIKDNLVKLHESKKDYVLLQRKIEVYRKKLAYLENSCKDNQRQCSEAEETLNIIKERYNDIMSQAKAMLTKAKALSKGFTPADEGFEQFREEYDSLPTDIQELNAVKEQFESRIACLNIADDNELQEYEARQHQIKNLTEQIEKINSNLNKLTYNVNRLQDEWLTPLRELVSQISNRFAAAFQRMGCAGEVSIFTGDNEKDFSQYGISIKVTYRNGEPLQELNSNIQSGGERAVATAAYMLALQELTPVPFRCVDEINQGMDANNERRIFELIVKTTCEENSSQYFLITPKLVPHLNYSPNMVIHIVHNGPFVAQDKKWGFSQLCNPKNIQVA